MTRAYGHTAGFALIALGVLMVLGMATGASVEAQFLDPRTIPEALTLDARPASPAPNAPVRLDVKSDTLDLSRSAITWTVNGNEFADGVGLQGIDIRTGPLGSETIVEASVEGADGVVSASRTFRPTEVDLLWESDAYTPPFFRGRSLPSAGSTLTLHALARFTRGVESTPSSEITYSWSADGVVLPSLSGRGKSSVQIPGPSLYGSKRISVGAASADGGLTGEASVIISSVEPVLRLYMNHPLFGVLYNRALGSNTAIADSEMTFIVAPLYAPAHPQDRAFQYAWRVDGTAIEADREDPAQITLSSEREGGGATITLSLTHATNWYLDAAGEWGMTLRSPGSAGDPFRAEAPL